jgi:hypothetical protein
MIISSLFSKALRKNQIVLVVMEYFIKLMEAKAIVEIKLTKLFHFYRKKSFIDFGF